MTDFEERKVHKFSGNLERENMSSAIGSRRGGKPPVEIYRPGSGPLRKSAFDEEFSEDGASYRRDKSDSGRDRRDVYNNLTDDFDRLSVCSNSSRKDGRGMSQNRSGSIGNLSDGRRRAKKPEVPIYIPPKPSTPSQNNQDTRRYKSKNYSNSQRSDSFKREDSFKHECDQPKQENDSFRKDGGGRDMNSQWSDSRSFRGESEPPQRRPNDRNKKTKKPKRRNGRGDSKEETVSQVNGNRNGKSIPSLLDLKFTHNPLTGLPKASSNYDITGYETSGYTTTDGESERDPSCSLRNTKPLPSRNMRQVSEPRSLPLPSVQTDSRGRDTRSVEPGEDGSWSQDRPNIKPPSGPYARRNNKQVHSKNKQYHLSFESLPPRLQKKYMEGNGFQEPPSHYMSAETEKPSLGSNPDLSYGGTDSEPSYGTPTPTTPSNVIADTKPNYSVVNATFIGTNSEDPWDGSSVTFQGTTTNSFYTNVPPPIIFSRPPPPIIRSQLPPPPLWSQTLPHTRVRGRGRVPQHELERERITFEEERMTRSLTPDALRESGLHSEPVPLQVESPKQDMSKNRSFEEQESTKINQDDVDVKPHKEEGKPLPDLNKLEIPENISPNNKMKSPVQPKSPQDLTFKKSSGTGMNWADEVELSERLQETLEEKESEDNTYNLSNSNMSPTSPPASQPTNTPHKDKGRRRRKRSISRERYTNDRRSSVDVEEPVYTASRSRKNSGDDKHWPRSRKNSGDDRQWPRSRKNSGDDRNWRRDDPREHYDNYRNPKQEHKFSSRNSSLERWTTEEYQHVNGSERKYTGGGGERYRRNSVKSYANPTNDRYFTHPGRRRGSRDYSGDRQREQGNQEENWREEARRLNGPAPVEQRKPQKPAGILVLPPQKDVPNPGPHVQRQLFDPSNPQRPLIINTPVDGSRMATGYPQPQYLQGQQVMSPDGHFVVPVAPPVHVLQNPNLLKEAECIDYELTHILTSSTWYEYHEEITKRRARLQEIMWLLLTTDIKFCEQENMEQYFWKILYYNLLEWLRTQMAAVHHNKDTFMKPLLNIIDEGMKFFENTLRVLEETYKFRLEERLAHGHSSTKNNPHLTMALMSAHKILLFLGDLARYREQLQDSVNYATARQWYIKAHQLHPKNGRPFHQLAILAVYARRKLEALYYYMRSMTAVLPVVSSKECVLTLLDENRKKFELMEKQKQEEREARNKEKMKEKECTSRRGVQLRQEVWIHPEGGRRVHRTTSTAQADYDDSEAELEALSHVILTKRFSMSFIHVHGKLFTKVGMESFQGAALQMLKEFRALLQHSPLPLNSTRLLQLLALNMFAIENTQLKNSELAPNYRSAMQESALVISLQMFGLILERTVQLLRDQQNNSYPYPLIVGDDVQILLPAIKVWCDWLLCHSSVWNPPPSCNDYSVGPAGDVWGRLASLVNLLERLDCPQHLLSEKCLEGYDQVKLPEDAVLAGFVPLILHSPDPMYTSVENNMEVACICLRIRKILFCGTVFLCGVDPPVLKLHKNETGTSEYISVVETPSPPAQSDGELCMETVSGNVSEDSGQASEDEGEVTSGGGGGELESLQQRKQQLERSHRRQEKRRQKFQSILQNSLVSVEMEVRPHYLVADTNCFIDYLPQLQTIARASSPSRPHLYTIMVPLVVLNELDGLAHGRRDSTARPQHLAMVTECAASALEFLRSRSSPAIRCVTTKGTILNSTTFTSEEDCQDMKNDDKILATCLKLCHTSSKEEQAVEGQPRKLTRDVVLLTEDRNLRVKAMARDVPVREVLDFMQWAGLLGPEVG
ncbi:telomerase-binding protein EST1A isoform X2 [Homalodisca vitripennis]|uniref:telomerase-binding protein EST1A isoform X2 n=1 Tax=Homalodisca vitripennis TaxID=197043 RepID=UPI001EEC0C48|nr:telomerase-binding protein EST1A isoform X2 [Homalodisca vitripennis]